MKELKSTLNRIIIDDLNSLNMVEFDKILKISLRKSIRQDKIFKIYNLKHRIV
mgnify:CR=1 FL=1